MFSPLVEKKEGRDSIPGRDLKNEATTTYLLLTIHLLREVILTPLSLEIEIWNHMGMRIQTTSSGFPIFCRS